MNRMRPQLPFHQQVLQKWVNHSGILIDSLHSWQSSRRFDKVLLKIPCMGSAKRGVRVIDTGLVYSRSLLHEEQMRL
jgi:hypothetical protein